jgi:hypothetical protein
VLPAGVGPVVGVEAAAVVGDAHAYRLAVVPQGNDDTTGAGVLADVGQRLLEDAVHGRLERVGHALVEAHVDLVLDALAMCEVGQVVTNRCAEAALGQDGRTELREQVPESADLR